MKRMILRLSVIAILLAMFMSVTYASAPAGKVTGDGCIPAKDGTGKDTFSVAVQFDKNGVARGNLEFRTSDGLIVRSTKILHFQAHPVGDEYLLAAVIGICTVNGQGEYEFRVAFNDYGEPGKADRMGIAILEDTGEVNPPVVYTNENTLCGGNIKVHGVE